MNARARQQLEPTADPAWVLIEEGFNLAREHEIESLFTVANGYIGTRGSLSEGSSLSAPATFIAGIYDVDPKWPVPELAVAPDWMRLRSRVDGSEIRLEGGHSLLHRRVLDMRQGIMWREWRHQDAEGRVSHLRLLRLASLADRHLLVQMVWFTPENYSGRLELETHIEPAANLPGRMALLYERKIERPESIARLLPLRTANTDVIVVFAATSRARLPDGRLIEPAARGRHEDIERWSLDLAMGKTIRLERIVLVYTSRETESPAATAVAHIEAALARGIDGLIADHIGAWEARWHESDIRIEGDIDAQRAVRFACYHLIGAVNPHDERVSVAARGLTGDGYKGHVFWDTEIFMLPFYTYTHPTAARALLMYRYHTLPAARDKAKRLGFRGALFPWESADSGAETTPPYALLPNGEVIPILNGEQEQHIDADVAYGIWHYWQASGDAEFLLNAGAEILFEIARFWESRVQHGENGRYHIRGVIGPDEYHANVDDNAYTNVMAQWSLQVAVTAAGLLRNGWPSEWSVLAARLELGDDEPVRWQRIAEAMYAGNAREDGVIEQFDGYFAREELDVSEYVHLGVPMEVAIGRERLPRTQVVKQPDVLMFVYLLWDRFPPAVRRANFEYYERRTVHGSSLSPAIHALLAARLGRHALALRYFEQAAAIDLANNMGNAARGVHAAALGGLWQAVVFGFAGVHLHGDGLAFEPHLPPHWKNLRFPLRWHALTLDIALTPDQVAIRAAGRGAVGISVAEGKIIPVQAGTSARWARESDGTWQEIAA